MISISDIYREESKYRILDLIDTLSLDNAKLEKLARSKKIKDKDKAKEILQGHLKLIDQAQEEGKERYEFYKKKMNTQDSISDLFFIIGVIIVAYLMIRLFFAIIGWLF